jgi:hypothetical protein
VTLTQVKLDGLLLFTLFIRDITETRRVETERELMIRQLQDAVAKVKTLTGLLPICSACKKVRDDDGYWHQVESYLMSHSQLSFTHGVCPECAHRLYPEIFLPKTSAYFPSEDRP